MINLKEFEYEYKIPEFKNRNEAILAFNVVYGQVSEIINLIISSLRP